MLQESCKKQDGDYKEICRKEHETTENLLLQQEMTKKYVYVLLPMWIYLV